MTTTNIGTAIPDSLDLIAAGPAYKTELCSMLERSHIFGNLSRQKTATLADYVQAFRAKKGTAIFVEGEHAGFMCVIVEGRLKIFKDSGTGRSREIAEAGPGNSLGEMSMIDGLPHSATAVATEPVTIIALTRDNFDRIFYEKPKLAAKILLKFARILSQRLRDTSSMLVDSLE